MSTEKHESGVRKYASFNFRHAIRRWWTLRGVGSCGKDVYVDVNVQLQRHPENVTLDNHVMLKEGVRLCPTHGNAQISIGKWTTVGHNTFVFSKSSITIGDNCLIAPFCYFVDSDHGIKAGELIRNQSMPTSPIIVGNNVWLGTGAVITKGVTIGDGAVIGAHSVVTKDVPENAIFTGNPARVMRYRHED